MKRRSYLILSILATLGAAPVCCADLVIVPVLDFHKPNAWSVDIDGDGIGDSVSSPNPPNIWVDVLDQARTPTNFFGFHFEVNGMPINDGAYADVDGLVGTVTFGPEVSPPIGDDIAVPVSNLGSLSHGTRSSDLAGLVTLNATYIELPTHGSGVGKFSGVAHPNDYYVITEYLGAFGANESVHLDMPAIFTAAAAVPEPSALSLGLLPFSFLFTRRRKNKLINKRL